MTADFKVQPAPGARCPMCRSLLIGMSGTHEFRMFPAEQTQIDLFGDGIKHALTRFPPPAVLQFTATFVPCGCTWEGRDADGLSPYVLRIIHADAGARFEFGHRQHDSRYLPYVMTHERTQP